MQFEKAAYFVGGALLGASVTYFVTKEVFRKRYLDMAEEEIRSVKETYDMLRGEDIEPGSEEDKERTRAYLKKIDELHYTATMETPEGVNVVVEGDIVEEQFDAQREESDDVTQWDRSPDEPYVITTAEFMEENDNYTKITLTYFEEDNTLVDDQDEIIPDIEGTVGVANLLNFGAGTGDKNTLYIRRDNKELDYEVIRNESSYSFVVLGIEDWHANDIREPKRIGKMRDGS